MKPASIIATARLRLPRRVSRGRRRQSRDRRDRAEGRRLPHGDSTSQGLPVYDHREALAALHAAAPAVSARLRGQLIRDRAIADELSARLKSIDCLQRRASAVSASVPDSPSCPAVVVTVPAPVRPACSARRSTNSICPFRLRRSSSAHRCSASSTSRSIRRRKGFRSAMTVVAAPGGRARRRALLIDRPGVDDRLRVAVAAEHDQQVAHHRGLALVVERDDARAVRADRAPSRPCRPRLRRCADAPR